MKKLLLAVSAILVASCSSVKYNYVPETKSFSVPVLEKVTTRGLGEPLLDQGKATNREIFVINNPSEISAYDIQPGKLIKVGEDDAAEYYSQSLQDGYTIYAGLITSSPALAATLVVKKNGDYCISRPADVTVCGDVYGEKKLESVVSKESFRRTLIYSGKVGNKLKMSYREFSGEYARQAFNTEVEYDLSDGSEIGYAGARIEVLSATNTEITYKVLSHFNNNL